MSRLTKPSRGDAIPAWVVAAAGWDWARQQAEQHGASELVGWLGRMQQVALQSLILLCAPAEKPSHARRAALDGGFVSKATKVVVKYSAGHTSTSWWLRGGLFCPECGAKGVWEEQSDGDYYVGPDYACTTCGAVFTYQGPLTDDIDVQVIEALRAESVI